ncbi:SH3 domain-containing protein [uncultured Marivita sp.]|uniref:SH3 domain-containing protein n=1 Tax=uncultured Marivita sp. TaxID=888080 RepID=UPI00262BA467|nr:SH3 domain-containing protein [uncultured Marivita sp.]
MIRVSLAGLALVLPMQGQAEPTYHRVIGVAIDDVLNIRAEPSAGSADIGDLPYNARRIEAFEFDATGNWARIALNERDGWVSTRFLTRDEVATIGDTTVPEGIVCGGTEPFWALGLYGDEARYSHPSDGDTDFTFDSARVAEGRLGSPALITVATEDTQVIEAILSGAQCNDGMSDRSYGWTITMQLIAPGKRRFLSGCCHLPRD